MHVWEPFIQMLIPIFGIVGGILCVKKNKWNWVVGLVAQPLFLITAINNHQIGSFITTIIFIGLDIWGIYEWFKENGYHNKIEKETK